MGLYQLKLKTKLSIIKNHSIFVKTNNMTNIDIITNFINVIDKRFSLSDEIKLDIIDFIKKSECKDIKIKKFRGSQLGISLHDGVVINEKLLGTTLSLVLFVLYHELTHQLQFKKYGVDNMYLFLSDVSDDEVSDTLLKREIVADRLSSIKIFQLQKKGLITKDFTPIQIHKNADPKLFKQKIVKYRGLMSEKKVKTPEDVSLFFNMTTI